MLETVEINPVSSTQRVSGELGISQTSVKNKSDIMVKRIISYAFNGVSTRLGLFYA